MLTFLHFLVHLQGVSRFLCTFISLAFLYFVFPSNLVILILIIS